MTSHRINPHDLHRLEGKTAIVTGSTRGIGAGIARRFADEGASVVVTGRSTDDGEAVATDIRERGGEATFVRADLRDANDVETLVDAAVTRYGPIHVVVNNAAAWRHGPIEERSIADWEVVMDVSLRAPWLLTDAALDHVPDGGRVINVSSIMGRITTPGRFPYDVSKAALDGLTRSLAVNLGPLGITVNGLVVGDVVKAYQAGDPDDPDDWSARMNPVGRRGVPGDIAAVASFLASDESSFVTGASIPVDGGRLGTMATKEWPDADVAFERR